MSVSIASNIFALKANTQLGITTEKLSSTFERLSSGLRINRASDDPAGLALADGLRADAAVAAVAIRNANDGISIASIADDAISEISSILSRMAELAEQSSNGTYTTSTRSALASEFIALASEVERISASTEFNDFTLLSNSQSFTLQVGLDSSSNSQITIGAVTSTLESLGLAPSGSSQLTFSINADTALNAQSAASLALTAVNNAITSLNATRGTITAAESRLRSAVNYLSLARENYVAAESRIRDADIAQEVAELVRLQVLQQGAVAMAAQGNLQPQLALSLLQ